jgi:hypothetical protein
MHRLLALVTAALLLPLLAPADDAKTEKVNFTEDFAKGAGRWEPTDAKAWKVIDTKEGKAYSLFAQSKYKPKHRSPLSYSLIKGVTVGDFVLEAKVQSTARDYGHRDVCLFFGHQGADRYYYAHIAKQADDHANQVFIVNKADRKKISKTSTKGTKWTDGWHHVKLVRKVKDGTIEVYFDDMKKPVMTAVDKTFTSGRVGVGSFDDTANWRDVKLTGEKVTR